MQSISEVEAERNDRRCEASGRNTVILNASV
jgi:hypothetical protein